MKIAVVGLGYVGLPLAVEFGRKILFHSVRPSWTEVEERVKQK